jgi:hypothetical protein
MFRFATLLVCLAVTPPVAHAADDDKAAERRKEIETQKQQADELWKSVLAGTQSKAHKETANFLLYGTIDENALENLGKGLEKALVTVKKNVAVKSDTMLWPGKLVVHVCKERGDFRTLYAKVKKETADKDETGVYSHERDATIIVLGPLDGKKSAFEVEGVIQLAAATLTKKTPRLPTWFVMGFSRAAAYRHAPTHFIAERQRARVLVQSKTAKDVWTENLSADEAPILTASFFDYLINGPQIAKFWPDLVNSIGEDTAFEDALKAVKLVPEQVDLGWRTWARR